MNNNGYNRSSNAYSEPAVKPNAAPVVRKKVVKVKKRVVYQTERDRSKRIPLSFYFIGIVIIAGFYLVVSVNANYLQKNREIAALRDEVKTLREANFDMRTALHAAYDENEIIERAHELGMNRPKSYQIKYIDVPKESYAKGVTAASAVTPPEKTFSERIREFLPGI